MISCKLGLVSFPKDTQEDYYLNLGEVYDKNIRKDETILYEFHSNLQYLCEITVIINKNQVIPTNIEEIRNLQVKYKLTPKIYIVPTILKKISKKKIQFSAPKLYDISCMVPLFPKSVPKTLYTNNKNSHSKLFIILPYTDPIVRGKIIKNCLQTIGDSKGYFLTIGDIKGENTEKSCELNRRYLISCGVPEESIIINEYEEIPEFILECMNIANMVYSPDIVFLGVSAKEVGEMLKYVRIMRKIGYIEDKISFICD